MAALVHLALAFNPVSPEIVSQSLSVSIRARLDRSDEPSSIKVLPITIHGDAAVTRQGCGSGNLNMSKRVVMKLAWYGTYRYHRNFAGFTTSNPLDARSTPYCTDIGKMVQAPIFHVNADDPEVVAVVTVWRSISVTPLNVMSSSTSVLPPSRPQRSRRAERNPAADVSENQKHPTPRKIYADKLEQEKSRRWKMPPRWLTCTAMRWMLAIA